jgi:iron complex outermembrane receptor protein
MTNKLIFTLFLLITYLTSKSQITKTEKLDSIIIQSNRIDIPFSEDSRTIKIITSSEISNSTASNINNLLQDIAGIDIRTRGIEGMQADIYIRGGNFEQTLILIDGIKVEDPQTGHHNLNSILPLEIIERIEIIKGPASRIYGQNAFSGAINIITKKINNSNLFLHFKFGSFNYKSGSVTASKTFKKSKHIIHYSNNISDGYRDNTDFKNHNAFLKSEFNTKVPINLIATFSDRKFGANNFYTNNPTFNEYEETQTSLLGVSSKITHKNWTIKPKLFWKRNQDMFLLKRDNPNFSRNFNISNKIGTLLNTSYKSSIGITGIGVETAKTTLSSNNLGNQERLSIFGYLEHRFSFINEKLDLTPGISINYFSDFGTKLFPGMDIGYQATNKLKLYWNFGKSYRVPSYTEMFISIPNFLQGNPNLKPEEAFSQEMGIKYNNNNYRINFTIFNRVATNLIDYIKETHTSTMFKAKNLRQITTNGFEINSSYNFEISNYYHTLNFGYTFLEDDYKDIEVFAFRYLINTSIKHHFTAKWESQFFKYVKQTISYRYVERPINTYQIIDFKIQSNFDDFLIYGVINNVFDINYYEKINIPMPERNWMVGLNYILK